MPLWYVCFSSGSFFAFATLFPILFPILCEYFEDIMTKDLPFAVRLVFATVLLAVSTIVLTAASMPRTEQDRQLIASSAGQIIREIGSD